MPLFEALTNEQRRIAQARLLEAVARGANRTEAAAEAGVHRATLYRWLATDKAFQKRYEGLFTADPTAAKHVLEGASLRAGDVLIETMGAMKDVTIKDIECPECGHKFEHKARIPDYQARLRASELTLKVAQILKDVKKVEGTVTHMTMEQRIALALYKAEKYDQIPAPMWEELRRMGLIEDTRADRLLEAPSETDQPTE